MSIVWLDRLIPDPPVASAAAVAEAEAALGLRLPADYLAVATVRQGAMPEPYRLELDSAVTGLDKLYHFEPAPAPYRLVNAAADAASSLPPGVVAFAAGIGGDYLCFDCRTSPESPSVVVLLHDHPPPALRPVADSFSAMVDRFVERPPRGRAARP